MTTSADRDLSANERELLRRVLRGAPFDGAEQLVKQIDVAKVVGGIATLMDLEVSRSAGPAPVDDGVIPVRAFVRAPGGEAEGEVIVWVSDGYLSGLEYAWYSDDAPTSMPSPERVYVE